MNIWIDSRWKILRNGIKKNQWTNQIPRQKRKCGTHIENARLS